MSVLIPMPVEHLGEEQLRILTRLTSAVIFEEFVQKKFMGAKRFSLEGAESLIPLLDLAVERAGDDGVKEVVLAMAFIHLTATGRSERASISGPG